MAEVDLLSFTDEEVIAALLRQAHITEGEWTLNYRIEHRVANMKAPDGRDCAGVAVLFKGLQLMRVKGEVPASAVKVNAATLWPLQPES